MGSFMGSPRFEKRLRAEAELKLPTRVTVLAFRV